MIHGRAYDDARKCSAQPSDVGCHAAQDGCTDALTFARDPKGAGYLFDDGCIPEGWKSEPYPSGTDEVPSC